MVYPYPTAVNYTVGFTGLFQYLNAVTGSWFSNMILIAIYIIFGMGYYYAKRDFQGSLAVGGFALFVISTLFWVGDIISGVTFLICIAVAIVSFASLWIGPDD